MFATRFNSYQKYSSVVTTVNTSICLRVIYISGNMLHWCEVTGPVLKLRMFMNFPLAHTCCIFSPLFFKFFSASALHEISGGNLAPADLQSLVGEMYVTKAAGIMHGFYKGSTSAFINDRKMAKWHLKAEVLMLATHSMWYLEIVRSYRKGVRNNTSTGVQIYQIDRHRILHEQFALCRQIEKY